MRGPSNAKVYTKLLNKGPLPATEINTKITPEQRRDGVGKFHPRNNSPNGSTKSGGPRRKIPVYYIRDKHPIEGVIRKWLDANEKTVEAVGKKAIHWRICGYGEEWKEASREMLGPFATDYAHGDGTTDMEKCPLCGDDDFVDSVSTHLPYCEEA